MAIYGAMIVPEEETIYTVFVLGDDYPPTDFETYEEAVEFAESMGFSEYVIESPTE